MKNAICGEILTKKLATSDPSSRFDLEAWVVNTVKLKMIKNLEDRLELGGRLNLRRLFLAPIFTIPNLIKTVEEKAPEIKVIFFKELASAVEQIENKLKS